MFQLKYTSLDEIGQVSLAFDVFISNSQLAIRQLDHEFCRTRLHYIHRSLSRTAKVQALVKTFLKFPYEIFCPSCCPTANATKPLTLTLQFTVLNVSVLFDVHLLYSRKRKLQPGASKKMREFSQEKRQGQSNISQKGVVMDSSLIWYSIPVTPPQL